MKRKVCSVLCAVCLLIGISFALPSCIMEKDAGVVDAQINENGELVLIYADGSEQNLGTVVGRDGSDGKDGEKGATGADGSTVITADGSSVPAASAKGLRSSVSIVCYFQATVQQGGWYPGFGNTAVKEYSSAGSGVLYQVNRTAGDAFVLTNYHVVYDASCNTENGISEDIRVCLYGSESEAQEIKATYVGGSLYYDIAVLRIEDSEILRTSDACSVDVADSDKVVVGDSAIAIGNAQGYGISASFGIISVDSEYITMTAADDSTEVSFRVMRVDTAVNSGNSGGGLFDAYGNLIGIVNAKIVDDGVESIGYAIPSNVAVSIAENIIDYCYGTETERVQRAMLGITVSASDSKAVYNAETGLLSIEEVVSVYGVTEGSLSDGVLQAGDVLVYAEVNGKGTTVTRRYHIIDLMLDVRAGDTVTLRILRNGSEETVSLSVTEDCLTAY